MTIWISKLGALRVIIIRRLSVPPAHLANFVIVSYEEMVEEGIFDVVPILREFCQCVARFMCSCV